MSELSLLSVIFLLISSVTYFFAFMFYLIGFYHRKEILFQYGTYAAWVALFVHSLSILHRGIAIGHLPLTRLHETLSLFAWCIVSLFLIFNYKYKLRIMGLIVFPFSFLCLAYALMVPKTITPLPFVLQSRLVQTHIIIAFFSYASFVIAFVTSIIYLYQEKQIKSKSKSMWHYRLPSLEVVDEVNYKSVIFGFPLLTLSMIFGMIWAAQTWGNYWSWQPKQISALAIWVIYAIYLYTRISAGWRGKKTAYLSIVGFLLVIFTYIGLHYLVMGEHNF